MVAEVRVSLCGIHFLIDDFWIFSEMIKFYSRQILCQNKLGMSRAKAQEPGHSHKRKDNKMATSDHNEAIYTKIILIFVWPESGPTLVIYLTQNLPWN